MEPMNTKVEILTNEDGSKTEKLTQEVCQKCRKLAGRCKCGGTARVQTVVTERPYVDPVNSASAKAKGTAGIDPEESKRIYEEKVAKKAAKKNRQNESKRIAKMDDEELEKSDRRSESERKTEKEIAERNRIATENVDEQRKLKANMRSTGASAADIKKAVKSMKANQQQDSEEKAEPEQKKTKRGRPKQAQLRSPMKDPNTGKFYSSDKK